MKLVLWILAGYVLYYIVLFIWDAMHNGVGDPDVEESQIIDVSDMAEGSNFQPKQMELSKEVREKYPVTLTADAALLLARMKDAQLAPLEAAAEDAGVDPTHFYTTRTLAEAFLAACDKDRMESFTPLFTGSSTAGQAALAALLPNTFLQALVWRTLTASDLPEVTEDEGL